MAQSKNQPTSEQKEKKKEPQASTPAEQGNAESAGLASDRGADATLEEENVSQSMKDVYPSAAEKDEKDEEPTTVSVFGHNGRFEPDPASGFKKWVFKMESGPNTHKIEDACKVGTPQSYPFEKLHGAPVRTGICETVAGTLIQRLIWEVKLLP